MMKLPRVNKTVKLGQATYRILGSESNGLGSFSTRLVRISGRGKLGAQMIAPAADVVAALGR